MSSPPPLPPLQEILYPRLDPPPPLSKILDPPLRPVRRSWSTFSKTGKFSTCIHESVQHLAIHLFIYQWTPFIVITKILKRTVDSVLQNKEPILTDLQSSFAYCELLTLNRLMTSDLILVRWFKLVSILAACECSTLLGC